MAIPASDRTAAGTNSLLQEYEKKKSALLSQYLDLLKSEVNGLGLKKDTSNLFRTRIPAKNKIDVRQFNRVLHIDAENLVADIEGMTPYEEIVKQTLKYGCVPSVIPELKSITIGGALSGGGIESSSFRYGLVHETILEYEILLGDGNIVVCRPDNEHKDLYYGFPNTYGTLGYALKVKVKLIPAKKFVKLTHIAFSDAKAFFEEMNTICEKNRVQGDIIQSHSGKPINNSVNYIEGVVFNTENMFITTGEFLDNAPFQSDYTYINTYYKSIQTKKIDYLTTSDYIWRWDTDWFWCSKHFYMNHFLMRLLFGKFILNSKKFWKIRSFFSKHKAANRLIEKLRGRSESVIQDVEIPISKAVDFLNFFMKEIGIWPIWVCPTKQYQKKQYDFYKMDPDTLYINYGFWDTVPSDKPGGYFNRKIEKMVNELKGNKSLYSNIYYTYDEFWSIFDKNQYLTLKKKYDPNNRLNDLYKKCSEKR